MIDYPPYLPLYEKYSCHSRAAESRWATPLPFLPIAIIATFLFLLGLWGQDYVREHHAIGNMSHNLLVVLAAVLPALVIVLIMLLVPLTSSPIWPYQAAMMHDDDRRLRWNMAVVATAHVYYGDVAQAEWFNMLIRLTNDERVTALNFMRRVRYRLQKIPIVQANDLIATMITGGAVAVLSIVLLNATIFEAIIHSGALMITMQMMMLYMFIVRWQHMKRLMELEEVFEELLPSAALVVEKREQVDVVAEWASAQQPLPSPSLEEEPPVAGAAAAAPAKIDNRPGIAPIPTTPLRLDDKTVPEGDSPLPTAPWER